jgi:hypothetical protein
LSQKIIDTVSPPSAAFASALSMFSVMVSTASSSHRGTHHHLHASDTRCAGRHQLLLPHQRR